MYNTNLAFANKENTDFEFVNTLERFLLDNPAHEEYENFQRRITKRHKQRLCAKKIKRDQASRVEASYELCGGRWYLFLHGYIKADERAIITEDENGEELFKGLKEGRINNLPKKWAKRVAKAKIRHTDRALREYAKGVNNAIPEDELIGLIDSVSTVRNCGKYNRVFGGYID